MLLGKQHGHETKSSMTLFFFDKSATSDKVISIYEYEILLR